MCFSAGASFGASIIIGTVGVLALKKAKGTPLKYIAVIPIFFGIQQLSEGFVWLANTYDQFANLKVISTYTFLFFAWIIWPIYIPFSFGKVESNQNKKRLITYIQVIGLLVTAALTYLLITGGVHSKIQDCSILYDFEAPHSLGWVFAIFYVTSVVLPTIISSLKKAWWLGLANILLYFVSKVYVNERVISVWCFFAAFTSILLIWIIILELGNDKTSLSKKE